MNKKFKPEECIIPEIWCGDGPIPKKKGKRYTKAGSRYECMKKGYGAGFYTEKRENLPATSTQNIKYIGEIHERNLKTAGFPDLKTLRTKMEAKTTKQVEGILRNLLVKANGVLDAKAYNSMIMYLYNNGVGHVPACKKIA